MENNEIIIKEVVIAKMERLTNKFYGFRSASMLEKKTFIFKPIKTITCVIDEENNKAIDIETNEVWDIIRRNSEGNISKEEYDKILSGEICALRLKNKDWDKISMFYQLDLKSRAKKVYQRYLSSLEHQNAVKKIGKKEK